MKNIQPIIYSILIAIGVYIGSQNKTTLISTNNKITNILEMINGHYVDSVNYMSLENDAITSILNELDPHSSYIPIKDFKSVKILDALKLILSSPNKKLPLPLYI